MTDIQNTAMQNQNNNRADAWERERTDTVHKENTNHKDSLFVDLFYSDETANENLLSLYNALNGASLTDPGLIHRLKIDDVLYKNFKNDISFEVNGQVFVFGEHQSTINPNMPLRCLMYAGRGYEQLVSREARYRTKLVKIPTPEFFVFYNGREDAPPESELRLSDAYLVTAPANSLELKVRVININTGKGHEILKKCKILREYSLFVDTVRRYQDSDAPEPIKEAVLECMKNGILAEYLSRKGSEVVNMLIAEYDYETDIRVKQDEAREEGRKEGREEGREQGTELKVIQLVLKKLKKSCTVAQIADALEEPEEKIRRIIEAAEKYAPGYDERQMLEEIMKENPQPKTPL